MARSLASLLPDTLFAPDRPDHECVLRMVPVSEIQPNPEQPRRTFDEGALQTLVDSIRENGLLSPLVVREEDGMYYLIAGERRLRAAARAGLSEVPVMLREAARPSRQLELALVENLQRTDLDPVEAARGYARLVRAFGYTQAQVGRRVGRDRSTVANAIRLLDLPEFALDALKRGHITAGHARALLPVDDPAALRALLGRVVEEGLSVRTTERLVRTWLRGPRQARMEGREPFEGVEGQLSRRLSTRVIIQPRQRGGGRIVIEYGDAEHLESLLRLLGDG
jgi:ParB family chromosome partitioning protein